jgi:hypothetical protein
MDWFKKLFFKKKSLEEVSSWLKEEQEKAEKEQQQAINAGQQALPELLRNVKEAIAKLEKAELRNPNIPERAKHFMQGNREQFIRLTNKFIENIFIPKDGPDISQIDLLFHQYAQNAARPATILLEFFGEEVKKLRSAMASIEEKIVGVKKTQAQKDSIKKTGDLIQKIEDIKNEKETTEKQQAEFQTQLQQLTNKRDTLKKEKEEFTKRPEYAQVKDDIISSAKERQEAEQDITGLFLALSDAIKKYAHKIKNEKIAKYAENPFEALIKDYSLAILKYKEDIAKAVTSGELELKPEKTQKALEAIKQLTKEKLGAMIHRYAKAKKREADIQGDVAERPIMKEYTQYAEDIKTANTEIEQLEKTIAKLKIPTDEETKEELKRELVKFKITLVL